MKKVFLVALVACLGAACVEGKDEKVEAPPSTVSTAPAAASVATDHEVQPAAPALPVALQASEVPHAAMAAEMRLRAMRSLASIAREPATIAAAVPDRFEAIDSLAAWTKARTPRQETVRALRSLAQEWRNHEEVLREWMDAIGKRLESLSRATDEIRALEATWSATQEALVAGGAAPEIVERATKVLGSIREVAGALQARLDQNLLLQNRISGKRLDAEDALDEIGAALHEEQKNLLVIESPPLWKVMAAPPDSGSLGSEIGATIAESRRAIWEYLTQSGGRILGQLLVLVALTVFFYRLRRRIGIWPMDDRGVRTCASVVRWPFMGASLVTLLLTPEFHPRAPLAFDEVMWLLSLPPLLAVMTRVVTPGMRAPLWALAGLFAVERIWELTWAGSILERLVLLGLTLLSAGVLFWAIVPGARAAAAFQGRWWSAVTTAGRIGLLAFGISFVSNLLGNVSLARLLTSTVVRASYLAVFLYAAALLFRGTLTLLLASPACRSIRTVARYEPQIRTRGGIVIDSVFIVWWGLRVLSMAGFGAVVWSAVGEFLGKPWGIGAFRFSFGTVLVFLAAIYASILLSRLLRALLEEDVFPRVDLPRGVPGTLTMLIRYAVISIGVLLAAAVAGIPIDRLTIVFGALSVGIGFGLQTIVNNFVSGLIIMFERPIQIGDTVEIGGLLGRVRIIGVRACTVETFDGAEVIVPNGMLISGQLINWTLSNRDRRIEVQVGVAYGSDPVKVMQLLREAALADPNTLSEPPPYAILRGFGESALSFSLLFWTKEFEGWMKARSNVNVRVDALLRENGIEIPVPQSEVRILSEELAPGSPRPPAAGSTEATTLPQPL